jgi:ribosomal protein S18 acetylase RimI-like enzyme
VPSSSENQPLIRVRVGTPDDITAAEHVWRESVTARDGKAPSAEVVKVVHRVLRSPETGLFVADEGTRLVAMACTVAGRDENGQVVPGVCHLQMIFVLPDAAGAGIGSRLLRFVLADAAARGMRKVQLWVREDNERARSLYERHGFAPTGSVVEEDGAAIGMWSRDLDVDPVPA